MLTQERRAHRRFLCSHLVEISCQGSLQTAVLEDIGPEGVAVAVEAPLDTASQVDFSAPGLRVRAQVRYCLRRETDFRLGLRFEDGWRWCPDTWRPHHLWAPPSEKPQD
jgi:hypothetical protein